MRVYNILGHSGNRSSLTPLAVYTDDDSFAVRFCDEIKQFVSGYQCTWESNNELDKVIYIDYEQKQTISVGGKPKTITNRKTVEIHVMELQGIADKEQQNG